MVGLLGWKFWVFTIPGYAFAALAVGQPLYIWLKSRFAALPEFDTSASLLFGSLFFVLFLKPVWRRLWRLPIIGTWLSRNVFLDLNGNWNVDMNSNYSRIKRMAQAAKDSALDRYDAENNRNEVPLMHVSSIEKAIIDQDWNGVRMTLCPVKDDKANADQKLRDSVTIAFDLSWNEKGQAQIAYVYEQKNKPEKQETTNDDIFRGGAILVANKDATELRGIYFSAQRWLSGLNTAGEIVLTRKNQSLQRDLSHRPKAGSSTAAGGIRAGSGRG